jgi:hypothetical protein
MRKITSFHDKNSEKLGIVGMYVNITKVVYDKPMANIMLSRETETISSKVRNKTWVSTLPLLFHIVLEFLAREIRQEKEIKGIQIGKEKVKLFFLAGDMILYLKP